MRTALVTGAARGIGKAVASRLLKDGFAVAIADINAGAAGKAVSELAHLGEVFPIEVDLTDAESVRGMVRDVRSRRSSIDVLVNNAGIGGKATPVVNYPEEEWRRVLAVNLDAVFYCCKAVLPMMIEHGSGRIINIASISGKEGNPNMSAYSSSKAAVIGFTKALAKEVATQGIYVNCVTPAVIETEILTQLTEEAVNYMVAKIPMKRVGKPEEVAALVAWLASEECSFSTGAVFDISGGRATY
jgi:NAD(P)-dependent dehydrogenase (short-subunit alcohol dehydrogenase family)